MLGRITLKIILFWMLKLILVWIKTKKIKDIDNLGWVSF